MKNRIFFSIFIAAMALAACNDFLEVEPRDMLSDAATWSNTVNADMFLNTLYGEMPTFSGNETTNPIDPYDDHCMTGFAVWNSRTTINTAAYTASNAPSRWYYAQIRRCNVFISNVSA